MNNTLWKDAKGDDLPEIDREVIVIDGRGRVFYAHRPPESYIGTSVSTGITNTYYPERYGNGKWNIPDMKYWLDLDLPNDDQTTNN